MADENPTLLPAFDAESWLAKDRVSAELTRSIRPANKTALFDALDATGITTVIVEFDGYGDSGQIEGMEVQGAVNELPDTSIELASASWGDLAITREALPLSQAVEALVYDLLRVTHCGWENNAGAYGEFTFDVTDRTITLDYNERFESSEYMQHVF